jgi:nucleotide-binding universal stress UspA family protein
MGWSGVASAYTSSLQRCRSGHLRCRAGEHEATDHPQAQQHELLGDVAAEREAQQIDLLQAEGVDERERVASHGGDVLRDHARRTADTAVVDEDDLSILREAVDQRRVPVVEVPPEVLKHHQRRRGLCPLPKRR